MAEGRTAPTLADLITTDPHVMGGRRVFRGTRVPVEVLFENFADGMSLDEILSEYETLNRDDVVAVLELRRRPWPDRKRREGHPGRVCPS